MSFITFQCYACGQMLKVGADKAGRKAKCHNCATVLTIPVTSTAPEEGAPPAAAPAPAPAAGPASASRAKPPPLPPESAVRRAAPTDQVVAAPARATPVAPVDDDRDGRDRPRRRRRDEDGYDEDDEPARGPRSERAAWSRARLGLLLVFIGACVLGGAFALEVIAYLLQTIDVVRLLSGTLRVGPGGSDTAMRVLMRISLLLEIGAGITATVGFVFCILGPWARGALGLAIATTAVAGVYVLLLLVYKVPLLFSSHFVGVGEYGSWFGFWFMLLLLNLLFAAQFIVFCFYLRSLSLIQKERANASGCILTMIAGCAYAGERLLTFIFFSLALSSLFSATVVIGFGRPEPPRAMIWMTLIFLWIGVFLFTAFLVMFILRVWKTRALAR